MARLGVTYQQVVEAATQLTLQDLQPTIESIRHMLGTGSSTTIATHLKKWRAKQNKTEPLLTTENIPTELSAMVKNIWEQLCEEANENIKQKELQHTQVLMEHKKELEKYKNNNRRWQQLYYHWHQEKIRLACENDNLERDLELTKNENTHLQATHHYDLININNKDEQIEKLQHLLTQTQKNFENHLEAERKQRNNDKEMYEQRIQELLSQINSQQNQIKEQDIKLIESKETNDNLENQYQNINNQYIQIETKYQTQNELIKKHDEDKKILIKINHTLQYHNQKIQEKLENKIILLTTSEATRKVLEKELFACNQTVLELQNKCFSMLESKN